MDSFLMVLGSITVREVCTPRATLKPRSARPAAQRYASVTVTPERVTPG
jgi:hypothetical protein